MDGRPVSTTAVAAFEDAHFALDRSKVKLGDVLGKGAFSTVYKATYNSATIAVKVQAVLDADLERYLRQELAILRRCNHPGLVKFVGACRIDDDTYYIATEYCPGGDLRRLLESAKPLSWHQRARILAGAADALAYLHDRDMIHRDIKTENVLLDAELRPKLCDFGFARTADLRNVAANGRPMTMLGTDEFMAPEVMFSMPYDASADVFGLGVVVAETLARRTPGKKSGFLERHPANGFAVEDADLRALENEFGAPKALVTLCERMLSTEPTHRPGSRECADELDSLARSLAAGAPAPTRLTEIEMLANVKADLARREAEAAVPTETRDEDDVSAMMATGTRTRMAAAELAADLQKAVLRAREFEPPGDDGKYDDDDDDAPPAKPSPSGAAARRPQAAATSKSSPRLLAGQDGAPGAGFSRAAANRRSQMYHAMSGYVMKRGGRIRTWRSRFMVVTSEGLVYFKSKEDFVNAPQAMLGSIPFQDMVKPPGQNSVADTVGFLVARRSNAFRIMTKQRPRFMQTPDAKLSEKWVRAINLAFSTWCLNHQRALAPGKP